MIIERQCMVPFDNNINNAVQCASIFYCIYCLSKIIHLGNIGFLSQTDQVCVCTKKLCIWLVN